ncbi:MAG: hypothetical protein JNL98_10640 [Bryobacterales bacterium]|nr:hypothetical protein [Bryobacterales bacterium]
MRLGLVVEGSHVFHQRTKVELLEQLWATEVPRVTGSVRPVRVIGMSKGSLAAMKLRESSFRRSSSLAEPLDALIERFLEQGGIDCLVVVWDLLPPWDRSEPTCRWTETLAFYEGLALSTVLRDPFRSFAEQRFQELRRRVRPDARRELPKLVKGAIYGVCIDPLFESVFMDERAMKRSLGVVGKRMQGWPGGWEVTNSKASDVVAEALDAARDAAPTSPLFRRNRQPYETSKTEWAIHFLQSGDFHATVRQHPLGVRLAEIGSTVRSRRKRDSA